MSEKVNAIIDELKRCAGLLGWPVDHDRPFDIDEDSLPRVSVWTGSERTVSDGPAAAWAEEVEIAPLVEVLVEDSDPETVGETIRAAWADLRAAIRATPWKNWTVSGSVPSYEKTALVVEDKPGISGFAVSLSFRVELD